MDIAIDIAVILLLIVLNGVFALSELALVSANRSRLAVLEEKSVKGAAEARALAEDPQRFLPTVQVGITLVGILAGVFGGARIAGRLSPVLEQVPFLRPFAGSLSLGIVVLAITYLTMVIGELVPKQLALREPELVASVVARPLAALSRVTMPVVWLLNGSSALVLMLLGAAVTPERRKLPKPARRRAVALQ